MVLVQTEVGSKLPFISFTISKDPDVKVITAGNIITSVRQNLVTLFGSTLVLSFVLILANALMISAIFSTIVNERKRELGILRAIGASKISIFKLIVSEAAILTSMGGALGVFLGIVIMRVYQRTIIFNLKALNMPYLWPPVSPISENYAELKVRGLLVNNERGTDAQHHRQGGLTLVRKALFDRPILNKCGWGLREVEALYLDPLLLQPF